MMNTSNKDQKGTKQIVPDQSPIDESPLAKPELVKKDAKIENKNKKVKKKVDKKSEWHI
jgi:hypothetical protein